MTVRGEDERSRPGNAAMAIVNDPTSGLTTASNTEAQSENRREWMGFLAPR